VVVAGAGLGGLAAAALLSARGKKVMVSTPHASLAEALGVTAAAGFLFSSGPALLHGFEAGGAFQRLFLDSDLPASEPTHPDVYQVALPDRRITVSPNQEETHEELRREFPREIDAIVRFYRDLMKAADRGSQSRMAAFFSNLRSAGTFIRRYRFNSGFLTFLDVQSLYFFQRPCAELTLATLITLCTRRPAAITGGYPKLAEHLTDVIIRKDGEIRLNEPSGQIVFHRDRAKGVMTAQGAVEAGKVLLCTAEKGKHSLFLGIKDEVVPVGMARDVLYLPDYARPLDVLACSLSEKDDLTAAPRGMRALAVSFTPSPDQTHDQETLIARVSGLVPFLKDFLVMTSDSHPFEKSAVPSGLSFKPLFSQRDEPMLFRASKKNVYLLHEARHAPLRMLTAARKFVEKIS
jgi:glycine/D-amino acid oxidase-like deaminating enzyme